jgi:uncharacterized protein YyaL (SSP411 family)
MKHNLQANHLANETSPYLRQHMYNPVDWYPWGEEALAKARNENKLLIISIGYSACHWCHVMEKESFEDNDVADIMNAFFVSVKVDREERPDLDHFYMDAIQVLNGNGGWPLNIFALPDGRPFYGGTYFYHDQWVQLCTDLAKIHQQRPHEIVQYAENLTSGVDSISKIMVQNNQNSIKNADLKSVYKSLTAEFDHSMGGLNSRNKFPMPVVLDHLLKYYFYIKDPSALDIALLTLDRMSEGGIFDHLAGGFARYSTDKNWKVPHFEKMLYDNAQLISVYTNAYRITGDHRYKEVVFQTIDFVKNELTSPEYGFYSALDADSDGEEGKYYVWSKEEFCSVIHDHREFLMDYFGINERGLWEEDKYVLYVTSDFDKIISRYGLSKESARFIIASAKTSLKNQRKHRVLPGLDDKILCSWNALMLKSLAEAYSVFQFQDFLDLALRNYGFIKNNLLHEGKALHKVSVNNDNLSFLDDQANLVSALISLYRSASDTGIILEAKKITDLAIRDYFDHTTGFFSYTAMDNNEIPVRKYETIDNVIPSSNAVMAENLMFLHAYFGDESYRKIALPMIGSMFNQFQKYPASFALWGSLILQQSNPFYEIAIVGDNWADLQEQLSAEYLPNIISAASAKNVVEIPLLTERQKPGETLIYVCKDHTCEFPENDLKKVIASLKK